MYFPFQYSNSKNFRASSDQPFSRIDEFFENIFKFPENLTPSNLNHPSETRLKEGVVEHIVALPGYGKDDVDVTLEDSRFVVVRTKERDEEKPETLSKMPLVPGADYSQVKAVMKNGMMLVSAPYSSPPQGNVAVEVEEA